MAVNLAPFLVAPVEMDPRSNTSLSWIGGEAGSGGLSSFYTPILYNGALYQVLQSINASSLYVPEGGIYVYQSLDSGASWSVLDSANGPSRNEVNSTQGGGFAFDGDHTIIVAWSATAHPIDGGTPGPLNLINFDLVTGTWGAPYATVGAPDIFITSQCFVRPDGTILVLATNALTGGAITGLTAYVWSGSAWSSFAVDVNLAAGVLSSDNNAACMDSTGNIHLFMITRNPGPSSQLVYQLVESTDTLGAFSTLQIGSPNLPGLSGYWQPAISGDNVLIGLVDATASFISLAVGTPLSAPVFTMQTAPGIDPTLTPGFGRIGGTAIAVDSTGIYAAYLVQATDFIYQIRLCGSANLTTPLTGWTQAITAFDGANIPSGNACDPTGLQFLGISRVNGNTLASLNSGVVPQIIGARVGGPTQYWLGVLAPPTPPLGPGLLLSGGSTGARFKPCVRPGGDYFAGQMAEKVRLARIKKGEWPYAHLFPVAIDIVVNRIADIPIPAPNVQTTVLQFRVPSGYRFWMDAILQDGPQSFAPGDAIWSVDINAEVPTSPQATKVQGLVNIPVPLGSWREGEVWPFPMPYVFAPLTVIRSRVTNINFGAGADFFTSGFFGFLVPVERGQG